MLPPETPDRSPPPEGSGHDPYVGVIAVLVAAAGLGAVAASIGGAMLANKVLLDVALAQWVAAGMLVGVLAAQSERKRPAASVDVAPNDSLPDTLVPEPEAADATQAAIAAAPDGWVSWPEILGEVRRTLQMLVRPRIISVGTAALGAAGIVLIVLGALSVPTLTPLRLPIAAAGCLIAAALAATTAHYLAHLDSAVLPEAPGLTRGSRAMAWLFIAAAASVGVEWMGRYIIVDVIHAVVVLVITIVCYALFKARNADLDDRRMFPVDLGPLSVLGSRPNVLASILDSAERQLGIDLRSTWALTVVRRTVEPLAIGLVFLGWLTTSTTVIGVEEQGLVERLGVPVGGDPLMPGLHVHWPWPVDKVFRIPVQRVQALEIGHEGEEAPGPENVLWAVAHAPNEFTLLLGNGRDLLVVDAAVQFRIVDPRAWRYHSQNPADALKALAYRAVMRNTVNLTLSEALSENVATLTERMRSMVQRDADSLGLGVAVLGFTVGGMHPPVEVAGAYEAVISAEIRKVTAVVNAQAFRNQVLPGAEATALVATSTARAEGAAALGQAAGEAWSFRTLDAQYRAAPEEFFFRRRLETLEGGLAGHSFTVVDARFLRDGGELWVIP